MRVLSRAVQWVLALVFAIAAGLKIAWLAGPRAAGAVGGTGTMFGSLPPWGQWTLIIVELTLAVWLGSGWRPRWGGFLTIVLLSVFLGAIIVEMGKPEPQSCGCMGALSVPKPLLSLWMTLALDSVLLVGALWVYFASFSRGHSPRPAP